MVVVVMTEEGETFFYSYVNLYMENMVLIFHGLCGEVLVIGKVQWKVGQCGKVLVIVKLQWKVVSH